MAAPTTTPQQTYLALIKAHDSGASTSADALTALYDQLKPIAPDFLLGEWEGGDFPALGHPTSQALKDIRWAGKHFHSVDNVNPIVVYRDSQTGSANPERVVIDDFGTARIREVKFRGLVSAAMVYDSRPVIDHFRYLDDDTVAGVMDVKNGPPGYHFYLTRYRGTPSDVKL